MLYRIGFIWNNALSLNVIKTIFARSVFLLHRCLKENTAILEELITLRQKVMVFAVRLHVMQRTVLLSKFCPSVRPSVRPSDACIVTKLNDAVRIF